MPSEHLPDGPPDHPTRLRQELEGKTPGINAIADAIADQIRRITRELKSDVPHAAEILWNAAHAIAEKLPLESNCALDALRIAVRQTEARLSADHRQQESYEAPGQGTREALLATLRAQRRARR